MDLAATMAVRATAEAAGDVGAPKLPPRAAMLLRFDVQQAVALGAADAAGRLPRHVGKSSSLGAAAVRMADNEARAREGASLASEMICPECPRAFRSDKAMFGHLKSHPLRGYKGASRPGTPAASAPAGGAKPRKARRRKEFPELSTMTWPVAVRRSRTPTIATRQVSADRALVLLREPPAPLLLEQARGAEPVPLQMVPPPSVEPEVLLLEPRRSEEQEAAFTLLDLYQQMLGEAPEEQEDTPPSMQQLQVDNLVEEHQEEQEDTLPMQQMLVDNPVEEHQEEKEDTLPMQQMQVDNPVEERQEEQEDTLPMQQMQVDNAVKEHQQEQEDTLPMQQMQVVNPVEEYQMPRPDPGQLEAPADHVAHASHHAPVEHIFGIIVGSQAAEADQSIGIAEASKRKEPMEPEPVSSRALVMFRDKMLSPSASKRPKKRKLTDQSPAAADAAEVAMSPLLRRNAIAEASKGKEPMEPEPVSSSALLMFRDKILSPGACKRPKKRALPDQSPAAAADAAEVTMPPPLRRLPSPASDRKFICPHKNCAKKFPTHQALGGHMANHNRANRCAPANMDGLAAAHAVNNIMLHYQLGQDALQGERVLPPVAKARKPAHSCSRCNSTFPSGQALGGHMRKHWLEARGPPGTSLAVPISDAVALAVAPAVPAIARAVPVEAASAPGNALAVLTPALAAPANALALALAVPIAAVAEPNGEPGGDFEFDLNEMPMV